MPKMEQSGQLTICDTRNGNGEFYARDSGQNIEPSELSVVIGAVAYSNVLSLFRGHDAYILTSCVAIDYRGF